MLRLLLMDWLGNKKNRKRIMWIVPLLVVGSAFGGDQAKALIKYVLQIVTTGTLPANGPPIVVGPNAPIAKPGEAVPIPSGSSAPPKAVAVTPVSRSSETTSAQPSADGPVRVYFSRPGPQAQAPGNIAEICAFYIDQTRQSLDVAAFELDNRVIVDALVRAVKRGVRVRLVTETNYLNESGVLALKAVGVPVVDDQREGALMHNKFLVIDNRAVWTGSMNFTENCAYKNNNHGLIIDDVKIAANYATKFQWMFEQRKFGGLPNAAARIPYPIVQLRDGTVIENYFSTHDRVADHLAERVGEAKQSLHFMAFSFTHDGIAQAMLNRARAGLPVLGVFEKTQTTSGYSAYEKLRSAGGTVQVYLDANPRNMHHKAIVIDGAATVAGSFNFSASADKSNDENLVIIYNQAIAAQFEEEFQRVYGAARAAAGGR